MKTFAGNVAGMLYGGAAFIVAKGWWTGAPLTSFDKAWLSITAGLTLMAFVGMGFDRLLARAISAWRSRK